MDNPLFENLSAPAFDRIQPEHFKDAYQKVFHKIEQDFVSLKENSITGTFQNSVVPFDTLFAEYSRLSQVLAVFYRNIRTSAITSLMKEVRLTANSLTKKIFQDRVLGSRFKTVYDNRYQLNLDDEDLWFLQTLYYRFESEGAFLNEQDQKKLIEIDADLIKETQTCFDCIMGPARKQQAFLITDKNQLEGIPPETILVFEKQARESGYDKGWLFIPERLLVDELLEIAHCREFRQKIHEAMNKVAAEAPYDNEIGVRNVARLRDIRARLLGYANFAHYQQSRNMAASVERVESILNQSIGPLLTRFEKDIKTLETWAQTQDKSVKLEPWDVAYYSAQYKKKVLNFDGTQLSKHLEFENVLKGWIEHSSKSMNLEFEPTQAYPVWDENLRVFHVFDKDTQKTSILYIDPYTRPDNKDGGAWMSQVQSPDEDTGRLNAIIFNMNLSKPSPGQKTFLDKEQTLTFYHEGGHALNGIKGQRAKYRSQRGTGNGSAFVEIHSILQERAAFAPEVLSTYAFDPISHQLPDPLLIKAMEEADLFLATRDALKLIQNAKRDLLLHSTPWESYTTTADIEEKSSIDTAYSAHIRSYPLRRFDHLFGSALSQYAAGYCGYYIASIAQAAAAQPFIEKGLYDPRLLKKQRDFYSIGAGLEPNQAYETFTGRELGDLTPYFKSLGITFSYHNK